MTDVVALAAPPRHGRSRRLVPPALAIGGLGAATLALALRDPHAKGAWGLCPSQALGVDCPGCGCLRAVNDLTHLRLGDALSSNLYFVALVVPIAVFLLGRWALDSWQGRPVRSAPRRLVPLLVGAGALLLVFTVLRNLPGFEYLAS